MSKRVTNSIALICVLCLLMCAVFAFPVSAVGDSSGDLQPSGGTPLYVNGIRIGTGISVSSATYVPFRVFCEAVYRDIVITWDEETGSAAAEMPDLRIEAVLGANYISANGRYFYLPFGVIMCDGALAVPLDELAQIFGANIITDEETGTINIDALDVYPLAQADEYYDAEDLKWLSHVINAEAGNQPLDGMIAVGNVVLNRVADPTCPSTVYDVIFDRKYGVQFSVTENGSIYLEPNEQSVIAAKICLEGYEIVGASLFFVNPDIGATSWFANHRTFVTTIGDHDFYA